MKIHEIRWAEESLHTMETASDLLLYEKNWKDFLGYLEVFWEKVKNSRTPSLSPTISHIGHLRKNDELLSYLKHARNSNAHTIRPILEEIEGALDGGGTSLIGGVGGGHILHGTIEGGRAPTDLVWEGKLIFRFGLDRLEIIEVIDRGQTYGIPLNHLGQQLRTKAPHVLAKLGLAFYRDNLSLFY